MTASAGGPPPAEPAPAGRGIRGRAPAGARRQTTPPERRGPRRRRQPAHRQPARRRDPPGSRHTVPVNSPGAALRVVIAEDAVLLREGLHRLLTEAGMNVAGTAGDAVQLLRLAAATRPDVVL